MNEDHKVLGLIVFVLVCFICYRIARSRGYQGSQGIFWFGFTVPFGVLAVVSYIFVYDIAHVSYDQLGGTTPDTKAAMEAHNKLLAPYHTQYMYCLVACVVLPLLITWIWTAVLPQKQTDDGGAKQE